MVKSKRYKDGAVFRGEFKSSKRHGKGQQTWPDGRSYDGDWEEDTMTGYGLYIWPEGKRYLGGFQRDYMTGDGIFWKDFNDKRSKKSYGEFENSQLEGLGATFNYKGDAFVMKIGSEWHIGSLVNGFKIVMKGDECTVTQVKNDTRIEWVTKDQLKRTEEETIRINEELKKLRKECEESNQKIQQIMDLNVEEKRVLLEQIDQLKVQLEEKALLESEFERQIRTQQELHMELEKEQQKLEEKLRAQIREQASQLEELNKKTKQFEETIQQLEDEKKSLNQSMERIKAESMQYQQDFEKLKDELNQIKNEKTSHDDAEKIKELEKSLSEKEKLQKSLEAKIEEQNKTIQELKEKLKESMRRTSGFKFKVAKVSNPVKEDWQAVRANILKDKKGLLDLQKDVVRSERHEVRQIDFRSVLKTTPRNRTMSPSEANLSPNITPRSNESGYSTPKDSPKSEKL